MSNYGYGGNNGHFPFINNTQTLRKNDPVPLQNAREGFLGSRS